MDFYKTEGDKLPQGSHKQLLKNCILLLFDNF